MEKKPSVCADTKHKRALFFILLLRKARGYYYGKENI